MTSELTNGIVVSSRIRLARNLVSLPFQGHLTNIAQAQAAVKSIFQILAKRNFQLYQLKNLEELKRQTLFESRKISKDLMDNADISAVAVSADDTISIMIHEEDHLREQCVLDGFSLVEAYAKLDEIDELLIKNLEIAYDNAFGFLTACPTNLGTGMRASIMLFLPALTIQGSIPNLIQTISKLGLTVRGVYGEGSKAEGYLYQISNQVTLGLTESEIISSVNTAVLKICEAEKQARANLLKEDFADLKDKALRAYGILCNCYRLDYKEFSELYARLKLGMVLNLIHLKDKTVLDGLEASALPAHLSTLAGKNQTPEERDEFRAAYVGRILRNTRIIEN